MRGKGHRRANFTGELCAEHAKARPWVVFDLNRGYGWGPGHDTKAGQLASWSGGEPTPEGVVGLNSETTSDPTRL